jgi:hypothetical protein
MSKNKAKPKSQSPVEAFLALSDAEKTRQAREFDREFSGDSFRPLTPEQRKLWAKAKRKRGRPLIGAGSKKFLVSMEKDLLSQLDRTAKDRGMTRSALLAAGARIVITRSETPRPRKAAS